MNKKQCPNCGNFKIKNSKSTAMVLIAVGTILSILIIGIPIFFLGLIMFIGRKQYTCETCGYKWRGKAAPYIAKQAA